MRKLIIYIYMLLIPLSLVSCKDKNQIHIDPKSHYIKLDSHDELINFMKTTSNAKLENGGGLDVELPDYKFDGVIRKEYVAKGLCSCDSHSTDDHEALCTDFNLLSYVIYCYTEENNCFIISVDSYAKDVELEMEELYPREYNDNNEIKTYAGVILGKKDEQKIPAVIFECHTYDDGVYEKDNLKDVPSVYTLEEAEYWYNIVYNTLKEYHS